MKIQGSHNQALAHLINRHDRQEPAHQQNQLQQLNHEQTRQQTQQITRTNTDIPQPGRHRGLFLNSLANNPVPHSGGQALRSYESVADQGNVELMNRIDEMV